MRASQQGVALLAVLLILAVITVALVQMQQAAWQDLARQEVRQLQQQGAAYRLGVETLARQVLTDGRIREQPRFWATLRGEPVAYPVDEGVLSLRLVDLRTCFNLNQLSRFEGTEASLQHPGLLSWRLLIHHYENEDLWLEDLSLGAFLDQARDWVDEDQDVLPQGAETPQYLAQNPPRLAANQAFADLSEVNWLLPLNRDRFRDLPPGLCVLPDQRLRLNVNTLAPAQWPLLWALLEGQVDALDLQAWLEARPEVGYDDLDSFWSDLSEVGQIPDDAAWQARISQRLMLVSDYYRIEMAMQLGGRDWIFESDLYLGADASTRIYARRVGPVDGRVNWIDQVNREEEGLDVLEF